ncbi:MAG: ABC transporter substrate-binding protein [Chloroflexi bacterium]|nr:ABC transporter substrate-binding protein [Chloroflexota bacterium]
MRTRLSGTITALVLVVLLATLPVLAVGCGETTTGSEGKKVTYGFLWDLTGRGSYAVVQLYNGVADYVRMANEKGLLSGVDLKILTYDTKSDPSRVPAGYVWLQTQGMSIMTTGPTEGLVIETRYINDKIPVIASGDMVSFLGSEWYLTTLGPVSGMIETLMRWVMDTWDYSKGKPKIGFVSLAGVPFYQEQLDTVQSVVQQNPDKFQSLKSEMAPTTTTSWAIEVQRLKDSDFILLAMSGPPLASFVKDARAMGYANRFLGPQDSTIAYWNLITGLLPKTALDGTVAASYFPFLDDPCEYSTQVKEYLAEHRAGQPESDPSATGYVAGWAMGLWLVDIVTRAAKDAGDQAIDGSMLQAAILGTDLDVPGWGNHWTIVPNINCLCRTVKTYEYKAAQDKWVSIRDWYQPALLKG